ncbi:MAG: flagellin [Phycisphaerales bacterium]|nr:flagellin [Phycisphaerales bacterium]
MARINSNIPSLIAQSKLARTQQDLQVRLERLSTGLRINRGSDDPAGVIISERIRADLKGVSQGIENGDRASSVISTTEAALSEVADLLNSIRSLLVESANTGANSKAERDANQLQIDSAIDSITRISNTASFGGLKLLNGGQDYQLSGVRTSAVAQVKVTNASFINNSSLQVDVDVVASAQTGALYYRSDLTTPTGYTASATTLEITGPNGVQVITIPSGQSISQVVNAVNRLTSLTGVEASLVNGDVNSGMVFSSETYGSSAFVSVKRLGGPSDPNNDYFQTFKVANGLPVPSGTPFPWAALITAGTLTNAKRDDGQDVQALVNGNLATGDGIKLKVNSSALGMDLLLTEDFATDPTLTTSSFYITGGGALFQLGQDVSALQQANIGIQSIAASNVGGTMINDTLYFLSSLKSGQTFGVANSVTNGDFSQANNILTTAIDEVAVLRGRLGAFERNVLQTNTRSLQSAFENLSSSVSVIRDADFAAETSELTRAQILASSGTSVLQLANQQSQQVLQLLG